MWRGVRVFPVFAFRRMARRAKNAFRPDPTVPGPNVHSVRTCFAVAGPRPHGAIAWPGMTVGATRMAGDLVYPRPRVEPFGLGGGCGWRDVDLGECRSCGGDHKRCDKSSCHESAHQTKSMCLLKGISRIRCPVAAKIALPSAGAAGGTPGSPTPRMPGMFSRIFTSMSGV